MTSSQWEDPPEDVSEPGEAQAPPERSEPVFGSVPGEAPTADLGSPAVQPAPTPEEPQATSEEGAAEREQAPAPAEPLTPEPPLEPPIAQEPPPPVAPEPPPQLAPDADTVAGDGHGPGPNGLPSAPYASTSLWERPEFMLGVAFAGGLLLAALIRRRRS